MGVANGRLRQHHKMAGSIVKRVRSLLSTPTFLISHGWNRTLSSSAVCFHHDNVQLRNKRASVPVKPFVTVSAWNGRNHVLRPWSRILHTTSWTRGLEEFFPTDGNSIEEAEKTGKPVRNVMLVFDTRIWKWRLVLAR